MVEHVFRYAVGQGEFLQVHRKHPVDLFETDRIGICLAAVHPKKRARLDVIEASVLNKELDGRPGVRTFLDLVEEDQRLSRDQ